MKKSLCTLSETLSWIRTGRSFRTSEGNTATGAQKAKQREITTEIIDRQHLLAEKQLAHLPWLVGVEC